MDGYDVVIAGAGVIGASVAFELASASLRVALVDSQEPGREASWASAGMISPAPERPDVDPLMPLAKASAALYPEFVQRVEEVSGQTVGYRPDGALELFFHREPDAAVSETLLRYRNAGIHAEALSIAEARKLEPHLSSALTAAIHRPHESSVDNRLLTVAILEAARRKGVDIRAGDAAHSLLVRGNACAGLQLRSGAVEARWTIIAAGSFSASIRGAEAYARVLPAKGQILALRPQETLVRRALWSEHAYLVPRNDGRVLVGATIEYVDFDRTVTAGGLQQLLADAIRLIPALASAPIDETWAGLRPDSEDHQPIIGPADLEGLLIATGHFRNGILLAPITAKLVREWITTAKVSVDWQPFSPLRFRQTAQQRSV